MCHQQTLLCLLTTTGRQLPTSGGQKWGRCGFFDSKQSCAEVGTSHFQHKIDLQMNWWFVIWSLLHVLTYRQLTGGFCDEEASKQHQEKSAVGVQTLMMEKVDDSAETDDRTMGWEEGLHQHINAKVCRLAGRQVRASDSHCMDEHGCRRTRVHANHPWTGHLETSR